MRRCLILWILALALSMVGCKPPQTIGGNPRPKPITKIVSLSPNLTEIIGNEDPTKLVGRTKACNYPADLKNAEYVCDVKPNYELITKIAPQVIALDNSLFSEAEIAKLKQIPGVSVFVFDSSSLEKYNDSVTRLGTALGYELTFSERLDKIHTARVTYAGMAREPRVKIAMLMGGGAEPYYIAGTDSFQADVVRQIGAVAVAPQGKGYVTANLEFLLKENPDVIICAGPATAVLADTRLAQVKAVKEKRVFGLNEDIVLRAGVRVEQFVKAVGQIAWSNAEMPTAPTGN